LGSRSGMKWVVGRTTGMMRGARAAMARSAGDDGLGRKREGGIVAGEEGKLGLRIGGCDCSIDCLIG